MKLFQTLQELQNVMAQQFDKEQKLHVFALRILLKQVEPIRAMKLLFTSFVFVKFALFSGLLH